MPVYIIKLTDYQTKTDYYMEWSTIVDAPVTYGLSLDEFKKYYQNEYGNSGMKTLEERISRVVERGTSAYPPFDNVDRLISLNHAGENGERISKDEIIERYCKNQID